MERASEICRVAFASPMFARISANIILSQSLFNKGSPGPAISVILSQVRMEFRGIEELAAREGSRSRL